MDPLETPHAYDFWTAVWAMSVALGRNIIVDRGGAPVYLNLFCLLIAESGVTRKSTAVRHATNFAREFTGENTLLIETKITPELLEERMHKQGNATGSSSAAISISELVTFLGREKYVSAMPTLLTDLYDCPSMRSGGGSLTSGSRDLRDVFVSFLSASTPSWLVRAVNPDVIEGGFTSRVMFIVCEEPKRRQAWPEPQDEKIREHLLSELRRVHEKAQEVERISISEGGYRAFTKWYRSRILHRDAFRSSFQSREDAHVLRLAAFLSINDDTWHIQHNHIVAAIKVITEVREDGASIFEGTGSQSRLIVGLDKLRDKLLAAGVNGTPQKELTKAVSNYMDAATMKAALDIMHDLGMVSCFQGVQLGRGRPVTIWRGAPPLIAGNALDRLVEAYKPNA
jgi:hypothetical protein